VTRVLGIFTRFRWTVRPGSDLYLVYSHNLRERLPEFDPRRGLETQRGGGQALLVLPVQREHRQTQPPHDGGQAKCHDDGHPHQRRHGSRCIEGNEHPSAARPQ
jgi:hypothetical protein